MNNHQSTPPNPLDRSLKQAENAAEEAAETIIREALNEVRRKYDENGENPKAYHNGLHTREVMDRIGRLVDATDWNEVFSELAATENLGWMEAFTHEEKISIITRVLKMAAAAHDVVQDYPPAQGRNERESSNWLAAQMNGKFSETEIEWGKMAIRATITTIEGSAPAECELKQKIPDNVTPLTRLCAQLLCDADIGNLGSDWNEYWRNIVALFKEIFPTGTIENWRNFLNLQLALLENQRYHTEAGKKLFSAVTRQQNKQRMERLLGDEAALQRSFAEAMR